MSPKRKALAVEPERNLTNPHDIMHPAKRTVGTYNIHTEQLDPRLERYELGKHTVSSIHGW